MTLTKTKMKLQRKLISTHTKENLHSKGGWIGDSTLTQVLKNTKSINPMTQSLILFADLLIVGMKSFANGFSLKKRDFSKWECRQLLMQKLKSCLTNILMSITKVWMTRMKFGSSIDQTFHLMLLNLMNKGLITTWRYLLRRRFL